MYTLETFVRKSISHHGRLCPRQVLGIRIGLAGAGALNIALPRADKQLLVIAETDGCFVSGLEVTTGCAVRHRTLRVEDYGKVAAIFVLVETGQAVRLAPRPDVRQRAWAYAPGETKRYFAQLEGYQRMPAEELLTIAAVELTRPVAELVGHPGGRVDCQLCGEEIINQRQLYLGEAALCRGCAGQSYYQTVSKPARLPLGLEA